MNPAEAYILERKEPFKSILLELHAVIMANVPAIELKYKWRIPAYYIQHKPFCYLNHTKGYVDLGFWHAAHITVHKEHLVSKNRTVIKSLRYFSLHEIDHQIILDVIQDAYANKDKGFYN